MKGSFFAIGAKAVSAAFAISFAVAATPVVARTPLNFGPAFIITSAGGITDKAHTGGVYLVADADGDSDYGRGDDHDRDDRPYPRCAFGIC